MKLILKDSEAYPTIPSMQNVLPSWNGLFQRVNNPPTEEGFSEHIYMNNFNCEFQFFYQKPYLSGVSIKETWFKTPRREVIWKISICQCNFHIQEPLKKIIFETVKHSGSLPPKLPKKNRFPLHSFLLHPS